MQLQNWTFHGNSYLIVVHREKISSKDSTWNTRNIFIETLLSFNRTHLRSCAFCRAEPAQFFIYIYISLSPLSFLPDETTNVGAHRQWEKQNGNRKAERKGYRGMEKERTIITECHFGDIMWRARARAKRAYFIIESHHIGYTITILIRHNGYLCSSRRDQKRVNVWPMLCLGSSVII